MTDAEMQELVRAKHAVEEARRAYRSVVMDQYETLMYLPAIREVRERCRKLGHGTLDEEMSFGRNIRRAHCRICGALVSERDLEAEAAKEVQEGGGTP